MDPPKTPPRTPTPPASDDEYLTWSDLEAMSDSDLDLFRDEMDPGDLPSPRSPRSIVNVPHLRF